MKVKTTQVHDLNVFGHLGSLWFSVAFVTGVKAQEVARRKHKGLVQRKTLAEKAVVTGKTDEILWAATVKNKTGRHYT